MKVTHIFHSGFMLEMEKSVLLFDWYTGDLPPVPAGKRLYVFCSHSHGDHYSPMIWNLQKQYSDITYILDDGIPDAAHHPDARVITVHPHALYEISADRARSLSPDGVRTTEKAPAPDLRLLTLESTDMGVAFYIETEGKFIYHAADLNVWFWFDEPMEDNLASEKKAREEMQFLADWMKRTGAEEKRDKHLDLAFVPLDPRLQEEAPRCMAAFMEILGADYVFPMHYWEREAETRAYLKDARISAYADQIHFEHELVI